MMGTKIWCVARAFVAVCSVIITATACTADKSEECGPTASCVQKPEPVDLELTSVTLGSPIGINSNTGLPVVDSVIVSYTVRNNGTLATQAAPVILYGFPATYALTFDTVPALQPGQSVTRTVRMNAIRSYFGAEDDDRFQVRVSVFTPGESLSAHQDNERYSAIHHFAAPKLEVKVVQIAEPHIRVNDSLSIAVTVTNTSTIAAKNIRIRHCLGDFQVACVPGRWTTFGDVALSDLAPGESRNLNYTTWVPSTARFEGNIKHSFLVCVTSRADTGAYFDRYAHAGLTVCGSGGIVDVWPDYEACNPPVLGATAVTLSAPNCGYYPAPQAIPENIFLADWYRQHLTYLFALDAVAGTSYTISGQATPVFFDHTGVAANDQNPDPQQVSFLSSGRYYLKIRAWEGVKTISAR